MLAPSSATTRGRSAARSPLPPPLPATTARAAGNTNRVAIAAAKAQPAITRFTPRQPTKLPIQLAAGTPSSSASDCPPITQPIARPRIESATRSATSPNTVPM